MLSSSTSTPSQQLRLTSKHQQRRPSTLNGSIGTSSSSGGFSSGSISCGGNNGVSSAANVSSYHFVSEGQQMENTDVEVDGSEVLNYGMKIGFRSILGSHYIAVVRRSSSVSSSSSSSSSSSGMTVDRLSFFPSTTTPAAAAAAVIEDCEYRPSAITINTATARSIGNIRSSSSIGGVGGGVGCGGGGFNMSLEVGVSDIHPLRDDAFSQFTLLCVKDPNYRGCLEFGEEVLIVREASDPSSSTISGGGVETKMTTTNSGSTSFETMLMSSGYYFLPSSSTTPRRGGATTSGGGGGAFSSFSAMNFNGEFVYVLAAAASPSAITSTNSNCLFSSSSSESVSLHFELHRYDHNHLSSIGVHCRWKLLNFEDSFLPSSLGCGGGGGSGHNNNSSSFSKSLYLSSRPHHSSHRDFITSEKRVVLQNVFGSSCLEIVLLPHRILQLSETISSASFLVAEKKRNICWRIVKSGIPPSPEWNAAFPTLLQSPSFPYRGGDNLKGEEGERGGGGGLKVLREGNWSGGEKGGRGGGGVGEMISNDFEGEGGGGMRKGKSVESQCTNNMTLRRVISDWPRLSRELREQILMEDILHCFMGVDGYLIGVKEVSTSSSSVPTNDASSGPCPVLIDAYQDDSSRSQLSGNVSGKRGDDENKEGRVFSSSASIVLPQFEIVLDPVVFPSSQVGGVKVDCGGGGGGGSSSSLALLQNNGNTNDGRGGGGGASLDPSLCHIVFSIMRLCKYHRAVCRFVELQSRLRFGLTSHALCAALRKLLREFSIRVAQIETYLREGKLTLQKLRVFTQPAQSTFELLHRIVQQIYGQQGGNLLNGLHHNLKYLTTGDPCRELCVFLLHQASLPICDMLSGWIYKGRFDDPYDEFFIREDLSISSSVDFQNNPKRLGVSSSDGGVVSSSLSFASVATTSSTPRASPTTTFTSTATTTTPSPSIGGGSAHHQHSEMMTNPTKGSYWNEKFQLLEDRVPAFLEPMKEKILHTGKYLNVLASCRADTHFSTVAAASASATGEGGRSSSSPRRRRSSGATENLPPIRSTRIQYSTTERAYMEILEKTYLWSSRSLVRFFLDELNLKGRLISLKNFFFLNKSDYLSYFLEHAEQELDKSQPSISQLESMLDLSIRTSSAAFDPYRDDISCTLQDFSIAEGTILLQDKQRRKGTSTIRAASGLMINSSSLPGGISSSSNSVDIGGGGSSSNLWGGELGGGGSSTPLDEGFKRITLHYEPKWPLNLLFTGRALLKYQMVFRLLVQFKFGERRLYNIWQDHMFTKELFCLSEAGQILIQAFRTRERMLHFCRNFVYYATVEVIEPQFNRLCSELDRATTFDEMRMHHDLFLDRVLTECLLTDSKVLLSLFKTLSVCQLFGRHVLKFALCGKQRSLTTSPGGVGVVADAAAAAAAAAAASEGRGGGVGGDNHILSVGGRGKLFSSSSSSGRGRGGGSSNINTTTIPLMDRRRYRLKAFRTHVATLLNDTTFCQMINNMTRRFDSYLGEFLNVLSAHSRTRVDHHALHLLTRIDYNHYFSEHPPTAPPTPNLSSVSADASSSSASSSSTSASSGGSREGPLPPPVFVSSSSSSTFQSALLERSRGRLHHHFPASSSYRLDNYCPT